MRKLLIVCALIVVYALLLNLSDKNDQPTPEVDTSTQTRIFGVGQIVKIRHDTPANGKWEHQNGIPDRLIASATYSLVQSNGVWMPKIEPGEQAVMLTDQGVNLYLDDGHYQLGELIWLAIYDYGNPSPYTTLGDNRDVQLHMLAPPKVGQQLKLIVYRKTTEELRN